MADYKEKLDELHRAAQRKARDLEEKLKTNGIVAEGVRVAGDAARFGVKTIAEGAEQVRAEAERIAEENNLRETAARAADEAKRQARDAGKVIRDAATDAGKVIRDATGPAGKKAGEVVEEAFGYASTATRMAGSSMRATRASAAATAGVLKARDWVKENPGKAAVVGFSLVLGVRLGASFPGIDAVLLGSHPHWLTHSALPVYGLRKASEKFESYLSKQEELISKGELAAADKQRIEFERNIARYVGAPLLGAFSCAAGAAMWAQILQPGSITGAPISWLLGGNPFLDGVWLFANGVICFHQGYKFFMIALANQDEVQRVVREIKGLLPAAMSG